MKKNYTIHAKEWFDKVNGNSYYSSQITRHRDGKVIHIPFSYGYGDHYFHEGLEAMKKTGWIKKTAWRYDIISSIERDCLKRDVVQFGIA